MLHALCALRLYKLLFALYGPMRSIPPVPPFVKGGKRGLFVKGGRGRVIVLWAMLIFSWVPAGASAQGLLQGISGSLEFNYSYLTTKTTDASGNTVKTSAQTYNPRFQLDINTMIFPNLRLRAGGIAEGIKSYTKSDGLDITTTQLNFRPYIDLTLETPFYMASLGYARRQQTTEATHSPSITLIEDEYYAILGWRPEGLPTMDLQLKRTNDYDDAKSILNTTEDLITLNSRYQYKSFLLNYYGTYLHRNDKILDLDVVQYTHSARASYADSFLDRRVAVSTNYNVLYQETTTESAGQGLVEFQDFPTGGLSALLNDTETLNHALDPNPALIDGDLTASAGINIGLPPGVDTRLRNVGLDFMNPTEVNRLLLWIDKDLSTTPNIVNFFASNLKVYVSSDNLNWVAWPITPPITFGPFQNRFEIKFAKVVPSRQYIKVVTPPLNAAVPGAFALPNIFVTELQAFLETPAKNLQNKVSTTTHNVDLDVKTRILDNPSLFYELYGYYNRQDPLGLQRYTISNALYTFYRFNEVFSGRARVAREDGEELGQKRFAYIYDAALTADPLRTLHSSLVVNGRNEEIAGKPNDLNSIFLYNTAQLYRGLDVNLNGGVNFIKQETGESGRDFLINLQANIVPHRTLTLGLNYNNTISQRTGGEQGSSSNYTQTFDVSLSYNPFRTLYLFAFIHVIDEKRRKVQTLQNYAINWSPFPDGVLQFNIAYNENYNSEDHLTERIFFPSIRYKLSKRSYIQVSYQLIRSRSDTQKIDSNLISTNLKIFY
jgi:hypothetical protein